MFGKALRVGRVLGFQLEISWTFALALALLVILYGVLMGPILLVMLFGSVLLHELGHAVVARRLRVHIVGIELHFFGGAAKMGSAPRSARDEIYIALAGPAVSFLLAGLGYALFFASGLQVFLMLGWINLILGVFNLLPALPMDGGRVLRAALSHRMGRYRATLTAATVAQVIAVALAILALVSGQYYLLALTVLLWFMAGQERAMAGMWRYASEPHQPQVLDPQGNVIAGPQAPPTGPGGRQVRVYRLPGGRYVMVEENVRW